MTPPEIHYCGKPQLSKAACRPLAFVWGISSGVQRALIQSRIEREREREREQGAKIGKEEEEEGEGAAGNLRLSGYGISRETEREGERERESAQRQTSLCKTRIQTSACMYLQRFLLLCTSAID